MGKSAWLTLSKCRSLSPSFRMKDLMRLLSMENSSAAAFLATGSLLVALRLYVKPLVLRVRVVSKVVNFADAQLSEI